MNTQNKTNQRPEKIGPKGLSEGSRIGLLRRIQSKKTKSTKYEFVRTIRNKIQNAFPLSYFSYSFVFRGLSLFVFFVLFRFSGITQNISINTTGAPANLSAILDVDAAPGNNKGILIPRVALASATTTVTIASPATSLLVYNDGTLLPPAGYYYNSGTPASPLWVQLLNSGSPGTAWNVLGNTGTVDGTNFLGTTDNVPFNIRVNNLKAGRIENNPATANTFYGYLAGSNNTGFNNTANGFQALSSNTTGYNNTANGTNALYFNTTGFQNTANGDYALYSNTTASQNTANGYQALYTQSFSNAGVAWNSNNIAIGYKSLYLNQPTTVSNGIQNVAVGSYALSNNTTGTYNTAIGMQALYSNTTGNSNTATGVSALKTNSVSGNNTASGANALLNNTTASQNTAIGSNALYTQNTTSVSATAYNTDNVAVGFQTLYSNQPTATTNGYANTAIGTTALFSNTTGRHSTASGWKSLYFNTTGIGNTANGEESLLNNSTGNYNVAVGAGALSQNTIGTNNSGLGVNSLNNNSAGSDNVAVGVWAGLGAPGVDFNQCTFVGSTSYPIVARTNVTMLGYGIADAQCTGNNQVCFGNTAVTQLRAAVTGITTYSDARFKTNVKEDVAGLDFIMKLKPVSYNVRPRELYKIWGTHDSLVNKIDFSETEKETRIGFIAQDVEKAAQECGYNFPGIDVPRNDKEVYTLRYVDFIMPMVKGMQELNDSLKFNVQSLKSENEILKTQLSIQQQEIEKIKQQLGMEAEKNK